MAESTTTNPSVPAPPNGAVEDAHLTQPEPSQPAPSQSDSGSVPPAGLKAYKTPTISRHGNLRMMTQLE